MATALVSIEGRPPPPITATDAVTATDSVTATDATAATDSAGIELACAAATGVAAADIAPDGLSAATSLAALRAPSSTDARRSVSPAMTWIELLAAMCTRMASNASFAVTRVGAWIWILPSDEIFI